MRAIELYPSARLRLAEKSGTGAGLVALTVAAACCVLWVITWSDLRLGLGLGLGSGLITVRVRLGLRLGVGLGWGLGLGLGLVLAPGDHQLDQ